jgi:hypothetical protein
MVKSWTLIVLILVFVGLGGAFFYLSGKINNRSEPVESISPTPTAVALPDQLTKNFDPTKNTPVFTIVDEDVSRKILRLKMVFPERLVLDSIDSVIACEENDIKIVRGEEQVGTGSEAFFAAIAENSKQSMTLSGLCSDSSCKEINRQCILYLQ